jgi:hypothetical protein
LGGLRTHTLVSPCTGDIVVLVRVTQAQMSSLGKNKGKTEQMDISVAIVGRVQVRFLSRGQIPSLSYIITDVFRSHRNGQRDGAFCQSSLLHAGRINTTGPLDSYSLARRSTNTAATTLHNEHVQDAACRIICNRHSIAEQYWTKSCE